MFDAHIIIVYKKARIKDRMFVKLKLQANCCEAHETQFLWK
jgi:hypothetical protein